MPMFRDKENVFGYFKKDLTTTEIMQQDCEASPLTDPVLDFPSTLIRSPTQNDSRSHGWTIALSDPAALDGTEKAEPCRIHNKDGPSNSGLGWDRFADNSNKVKATTTTRNTRIEYVIQTTR